MTPLNTLALTILVVCAAVCRVEAFTTTTIRTTSSSATTSSCALQAGRRDFLDAAFSATAGLVIASIPAVARAEEEQTSDDLAMPSVEEQKKADEAMAERLRRKAELQQEKSRPARFTDSLAKEKEKQKGLKMSDQERRDEMCERLGRGC